MAESESPSISPSVSASVSPSKSPSVSPSKSPSVSPSASISPSPSATTYTATLAAVTACTTKTAGLTALLSGLQWEVTGYLGDLITAEQLAVVAAFFTEVTDDISDVVEAINVNTLPSPHEGSA